MKQIKTVGARFEGLQGYFFLYDLFPRVHSQIVYAYSYRDFREGSFAITLIVLLIECGAIPWPIHCFYFANYKFKVLINTFVKTFC